VRLLATREFPNSKAVSPKSLTSEAPSESGQWAA
jgi:hypothetical protein